MTTMATRKHRDPAAPPLDEALLDKALQRIIDEPRSWDQASWCGISDASLLPEIDSPLESVCGTTACLAGHLLLSSGRYGLSVVVDHYTDDDGAAITDKGVYFYLIADGLPDHDPGVYEEGAAMNLLGLTYSEAETLFGASNTSTPQTFAAFVRRVLCLPPKVYVKTTAPGVKGAHPQAVA